MTTRTMRRLASSILGDLGAFALETVECPTPGPHEVLLRVEATGLGYVDGLMALGKYQIRPDLPYVPGGEIVGTVEDVGSSVRGIIAGQRVVTWQIGGGLAEYVTVAATAVEPLPAALDDTTVAAAYVDYQTAHYALVERAALRPGENILVLGSAGGVGSAAVDIAARRGALVIAAASTPERRAAAMARGAVDTIDSSSSDMRTELRTKGLSGEIAVILDPVGGPQFEAMFRSLKKEGRHLVVGFVGGPIPALPLNLPLLKSASLIGVDIRHFLGAHPEAAARARAEIFSALSQGRLLGPIIDRRPLEEAADALRATLTREKSGKLVVTP